MRKNKNFLVLSLLRVANKNIFGGTMKEFDLVKLTNAQRYIDKGLYDDLHGIVIKAGNTESDVLFLNDMSIGDAIIVTILNSDLTREKEVLPEVVKNEIKEKLDVGKLRKKTKFVQIDLKDYDIDLKAYDMVELTVEDEKYAKYGVHKGEIGCVLEGGIINDKCFVDFTGVDKQGKMYGACITVKIKDLKKLLK